MMMGLGFGGLGLIFMLVFWVVIIGLAVWFLGQSLPAGNVRAGAADVTAGRAIHPANGVTTGHSENALR